MNNYVNLYPTYPQNSELTKKLNTEGGDNMNFNKCGFNGATNPNNLYDVYNGFIRGNMFPDLFNQYKLTQPYDINPLNQQAELLTKVDAYSFAAHDINLYLDTHPDDRAMIELYNRYAGETLKAKAEYESQFGPLSVNSNEGYPWTWNNMPWPWEK